MSGAGAPGRDRGPERLAFRPGTDAAGPGAGTDRSRRPGGTGTFDLPGSPGLPAALAHVPAGRSGPLPLVVAFHGAGGRPVRSVDLMAPLADEHGFAVLAPKSAGPTWDRVLGGFGPDVRNLDVLLERFASRWAVEALLLAGFSDGASYALSLGLGNGDVLEGVVAFSPGFAAPTARRGRPPCYVSHGVDDRVLPIDRCSRVLVPALRDQGHAVTYREFGGGHEVPVAVREEAGRWISGRR